MTASIVNAEGSLLLTLEEVSQLISHSHDPSETLNNIVQLIQGRFHTDVCSVYFLEPDRGELILRATIGLKPECVGQVRMRLDEGLTGLAAKTMAPVQVCDAFRHPQFKYFPEAGEDAYHTFLGVPLIEGGVVQGVLVVQTVAPRDFSADESRMLVTVASQLAPLVSSARLLENMAAVSRDNERLVAASPEIRKVIRGVGLSPGCGIGEAYLINRFEEWPRDDETVSLNPAKEKQRLNRAMLAAREEVSRQSQSISELVGESHGAILQAHLMLLQDRKLENDLNQLLTAGRTAESALLAMMEQYVAALQRVSTPFFQERIYDVKDVFRRILWRLRPRQAVSDDAGARMVLVAREASVMDLFAVDLDRLAAVVVERGGPQSHAAILARSLHVPMIGQIPDFVERVQAGQLLLVDGGAGTIEFDPPVDSVAARPSQCILNSYRYDEETEPSASRSDLPHVETNINLLCEVAQALERDAYGVGLFRTELLFLARRTLPTEDEQVGIYRKLLSRLKGRPASIRTFDLRPDKVAPSGSWTSAQPEALDWRRVHEQPPLQKLFKDQIRAIMRAAAAGNARILVPLVTRTEQLDWVLQTVASARQELRAENRGCNERVPLGIMVETAAVVPLLPSWAKQVDFIALGTNDLIASALGIDRNDPVGASPYYFLHPGVLHLIHNIVNVVHYAGRRLTVCGEMASDPAGVKALAAFGVDSVSVPVQLIGATRGVLNALSAEWLDAVSDQLLEARTEAEARALLIA